MAGLTVPPTQRNVSGIAPRLNIPFSLLITGVVQTTIASPARLKKRNIWAGRVAKSQRN